MLNSSEASQPRRQRRFWLERSVGRTWPTAHWHITWLETIKDQRGITIVEELVAVAILGVLGVALIGALSTGSLGARTVSLEVTARSIALAQMEYTKNQTYQSPPATYGSISVPANWSVSSTAATIAGRDSNVEKVTVTVSHQGSSYLTLEGYKANR